MPTLPVAYLSYCNYIADKVTEIIHTSIVMSNVAAVINGNAKYGSGTVRSLNQKSPPDCMLTTGNAAISLRPL